MVERLTSNQTARVRFPLGALYNVIDWKLMPKNYRKMTAKERIEEYDRLSRVLARQRAEKPQRPQAIDITISKMRWLTRLHKDSKQ